MNQQQAAAAKLLLDLSALSGHPHINRCVEPDGWNVDWDGIWNWRWSSGELILVEVLRTILLGHGDVQIGDLYKLDEHNRAVAALAVNTLFAPAEASL